MPIYEYSCEKCRHVFEEWVRQIDDNVEQTCPDCGAPARRILSNTSFVLKGGGWYVTDYGYRKGQDEGRPAASSAPAAGGQPAEAGAVSAPGGAVAPAAAASPSPAASSSPAGSGGSVGAAA